MGEMLDGHYYWLEVNETGQLTVGMWKKAPSEKGVFWVCGDDLPFDEHHITVVSHIEKPCGDPCDVLCECEDH